MTDAEKIKQLSQAYASAWSLVTNLFDSGEGLEQLEKHKAELHAAIDALVQEREKYHALVDAVDALLSNEEHAVSGGMCSYQKGSPTWQLWEYLRTIRNTGAAT